jgi:hypothetical protein
MNKYDIEYENITRTMANGGGIPSPKFVFSTPTGEPSKLTYLQQLLVRTSKFKEWFGDWEHSAKLFLEYGFEDKASEVIYDQAKKILAENPILKNTALIFNSLLLSSSFYKDVSKAIDMETLEPRVLYHGTTNDEFYEFKTEITGSSRPYAYFAFNKEYSEQFAGGKVLYNVFINAKKPFSMIFHSKEKSIIEQDIKEFVNIRYKSNTGQDIDFVRNKIIKDFFDYYNVAFDNSTDIRFWMIMARDIDGVFKKMLQYLGYDSVFYGEEIRLGADFSLPSNFTQAFTIFEPNQVKLADGRNVDFDPNTNDIRFEYGGKIENEIMLPDTTANYSHLKNVLNIQGYDITPMNTQMEKFEVGGTVKTEHGKTSDGKKGGYFEGRSHADGGIKAWNVSTNSPIEVEGGEVIITKKAVADDELKDFEGEMLTNREILSRINQDGGGVAFEDGGEIHQCNCSGKAYKYGGETIEDYQIIHKMNKGYSMKEQSKNDKINYGHSLMKRMKEGGFI